MIAKITSKGQITLPKKVREKLHLKTGDKIQFEINSDGKIEITPVIFHLSDLQGMLTPPANPVSLSEMNAAIENEGAGQ
ncbi:MAG: AbrB/MazE/SpoVT family DNA-binding domain-containing protein [Calditrichaeota bacterium]|nr:AbrB/MazE/SpoVT family DNA-binding domain-containing protein [Calditrichota bacterium]MCB0266851.1 AbrB/MazE/SpoVT family DNA-binding domain-containing protein [Calditrichota bacterium]MCB0301070.1 AbrB/MazE/SpoVT family DNA-binding domain-containing protein [Calditrichota bacterium]MCB9066563.1 AbrB/MazE/SpoVT family DNA-binding domain-containing protein [Calditrichia bacterium]